MSDITIHSRALLVSLNISTWTARKFDRKVTDAVNAEYAASHDAGRFNKMLLPGDAEEYRSLIRVATAARTDHYMNTLAWADDGWRLLASDNYMDYAAKMRAWQRAFESGYAVFKVAYPQMRDDSKILLNGMWRANDYPTLSELDQKFAFEVRYAPLPARGDLRLDLPAAEIEAIEAQVEDRVTAATRDAMKDAWARLTDVVAKMHERLSDPTAIFRDTLVGNLRDVTDVLSRMNVTGDVDLEIMRQRVVRELGVFEPATLRADADVRADTAQKAQDILDAMTQMFGSREVA